MIQSLKNLPAGLSAAVLGDVVSEVSVGNKNIMMIKFMKQWFKTVSKWQNMYRKEQLSLHPLSDISDNCHFKNNK